MQGQIRIIGGQWRSRKIAVPDIPHCRPTPNRVRETLFNWLSPVIQGAYCLDAFAGSGALGFEALSRGAAHVVLVDQDKKVVTLLQQELAQFKADNADIYAATLPEQLKTPSKPFDIVFLDPPFNQDLLLPMCFYLEEKGLLSDHALIYLEAKTPLDVQALPAAWRIIKSKKAGQVAYHLAKRQV